MLPLAQYAREAFKYLICSVFAVAHAYFFVDSFNLDGENLTNVVKEAFLFEALLGNATDFLMLDLDEEALPFGISEVDNRPDQIFLV